MSQAPATAPLDPAAENPVVGIDQSRGDFKYDVAYEFDAGTGLNENTIRYISSVKKEANWILDFRLKALQTFLSKPMPTHWATKDLENINFDKIRYYLAQGQKPKRTWDEVPDDIKKTFERLGIPEQERKFLAGVEAQFDSEAAYSNVKEIVAKQGVIFMNSTEALREHPELFRKYFGKVIPTADNKFSALNSAVFSGGSFIYVPKGVKVAQPLQAYFRINAENFGQFERTLIIADEGAEVVYMEGCTAPKFSTSTLHSAVVELVALKGAKIQYITVQNWANNVFNLVTKRGVAHEEAEIKWIDCNIGSPPHDEISGRCAEGPQGPRRGRLHRAGQRRPAPGHRRQDDPRGRRNHVEHRGEVHLRRPGPQHLPGRRPHPEAPQGLQEQHGVRRAAHQHQQPDGHLSCDLRAGRPPRRAARGERFQGE
jgi:Fe-S cluster assembly protein SufB